MNPEKRIRDVSYQITCDGGGVMDVFVHEPGEQTYSLVERERLLRKSVELMQKRIDENKVVLKAVELLCQPEMQASILRLEIVIRKLDHEFSLYEQSILIEAIHSVLFRQNQAHDIASERIYKP